MVLSRENLKSISVPGLVKPDDEVFNLPEKVLQFGTGVLLRGLPDYFIDKANRQGIFNGRVVVVKSTSAGSVSAFERQDGLYTLAVKGVEKNTIVEENIICSVISRVLSASTEWNDILACAHQPEMQTIISNTTETGLQLVLEKIDQKPPASFPGKLLAFLLERYTVFKGSPESGMVIIPTELIPDNGKRLQEIVLDLAKFNQLDNEFLNWLTSSNHFCSSLVDCIVPGKPEATVLAEFEKQFGYTDELLTSSEVYRLWAIEGDANVKARLSFSEADSRVIIVPDIEIYRELKLRLLNGTHTLTCGAAFLAGFETVKEAMDDETLSGYSTNLMLTEIAPAIPYKVELNVAHDFAHAVLDRFRNPYIRHLWLSITQQYSMKLKMRVLPVLLQHYKNVTAAPRYIAFGFAAWILFMKAVKKDGDKYYGERQGIEYPIGDDQAGYLYALWQQYGESGIVHVLLKDHTFWGSDLTVLPDFENEVDNNLKLLIKQGVLQTLRGLK